MTYGTPIGRTSTMSSSSSLSNQRMKNSRKKSRTKLKTWKGPGWRKTSPTFATSLTSWPSRRRPSTTSRRPRTLKMKRRKKKLTGKDRRDFRVSGPFFRCSPPLRTKRLPPNPVKINRRQRLNLNMTPKVTFLMKLLTMGYFSTLIG